MLNNDPSPLAMQCYAVLSRFNLVARWLPGELLQAAHQGDAGKVRLSLTSHKISQDDLNVKTRLVDGCSMLFSEIMIPLD